MFSRKNLPPTYLLFAMLLMIGAGLLLPVARLFQRGWNLLGLIPVALGVLLNLIADRFFRLVETTVKPFEQASVLVVGSVYGISRNPMYLGFVLILAGIAALLGSLSPWLVVVGFFPGGGYRRLSE